MTPGPVLKAREECEDDKAWRGEGLCVPILDSEEKSVYFKRGNGLCVGGGEAGVLPCGLLCMCCEGEEGEACVGVWGGGETY